MSRHAGILIALVAALAGCAGNGTGGAAGGGAATTTPAAAPAAGHGGGAAAAAEIAGDGVGAGEGEGEGEIDEEPLPPFPSSPQPAPDTLIARVQIPSATALIAAAATLSETAEPGSGAEVTVDQAVAMAAQFGVDLSGVDLAQPVRLLVLDPAETARPAVVVVGVADEAALERAVRAIGMRVRIRGGFAAIGTREALIAAGGYALTTLLTEPLPEHPTAELDVGTLVAHYGDKLDFAMVTHAVSIPGLDSRQQQLAGVAMLMLSAAIKQIDRLELALELDADRASLVMRAHPVGGGVFAAFTAAQAAAKFDLLARLPAASMSMGGSLDVRAVLEAVKPVLAQMPADLQGSGEGLALSMSARWLEYATGESAITVDLPPTGLTASGLWEVSEPTKVEAMFRDHVKAYADIARVAMTYDVETGTVKHRGVKLSTIASTPAATLAADKRASFLEIFGPKGMLVGLGVVEQRVVLAAGADAVARAKALIDLGKARTPKAAAETPLTPALVEARRRGESYLIAYDAAVLGDQITAITGGAAPATPATTGLEPVVFAVGAADGALTLRFTMPAKQFAAIATRRARP